MPTLRQYVPTSSQTGYYIQANVGAGAPITLQVSDLAGRIFTDTGYKDGDTVPTKFVWAMYDVGLISTGGGSTSTTKSANVYSAFTSHSVSAKLSDQTRAELIQYLNEYRGTQQRRVGRLRRELANSEKTGMSGSTVNTSDLDYGFVDSIRRIWRHIVDRVGR